MTQKAPAWDHQSIRVHVSDTWFSPTRVFFAICSGGGLAIAKWCCAGTLPLFRGTKSERAQRGFFRYLLDGP